jgi:2-dehydro-3-deoxyphosphogluconate aldolase/(4S)-4-hydroxy-2-oxoglutarate aldolase
MLPILQAAPVIPVIVVERAEDVVPLGRVLVDAGLPVLEITLRTPAALAAIRLAAGEVEGAVVGAGTVLSRRDLDAVAEAGARFAVSPGLTPALLGPHDTPLLPGVSSPSELMVGLDAGLTEFKFFPAVASGGLAMLKALAGPFPQARFCPTGGVDASNAAEFLALPNVVCVGGAWPAPQALVRAGRWDEIRALASAAAAGTRGSVDSVVSRS